MLFKLAMKAGLLDLNKQHPVFGAHVSIFGGAVCEFQEHFALLMLHSCLWNMKHVQQQQSQYWGWEVFILNGLKVLVDWNKSIGLKLAI